MAYSSIVSDMERHFYALVSSGATWKDSSDPLGDDIKRFEERIGLRENPEELALMMHKQFLKDQGKEWDDTPVGAGSGAWWDQDVEFTDMADLDTEAKRRASAAKSQALWGKREDRT